MEAIVGILGVLSDGKGVQDDDKKEEERTGTGKMMAMMNVRRRAQEYGGEQGASRDGFFRSCLGPVASPASCPQPLRRIGLWLAEPVSALGKGVTVTHAPS